MKAALDRGWWLLAILTIAGPVPAARAAHGKDIDRLYAHAVQATQKGDYWQALRDVETILRADPGWTEAQQLHRAAGYEAHIREGARLIDTGDWAKAARQLEEARVYKDTPALDAKMRLVRARLRQEEADHAADSRWEVAHQEARLAMDRGDFETSRARLAECFRIRPADAAIPQELQALEARAAAASVFGNYLGSVTRALEAGDWKLADEYIRHAPQALSGPPPAVPHADLLPPLLLYAAGRVDEAREGAKRLAAHQDDHLVRSLLLFLNARLRDEAGPLLIRCAGALYAAALLLSLYFGLRRELRGRAA